MIILLIIVGALVIIVKDRLARQTLPTGNMTTDQNITNFPENVSPAPIPGRPQVTINTSRGAFTLELRPDVAPKTVANFLTKFNNGYCNNLTFHRVEDWVVQGCDPKGNGTGGADSLPTETSGENFSIGSLGVARKAYPKEISNDSQFFIVKKDSSFLNGEYTYFGRVISGMDVINSISVGDKILSTDLLTK